MYTLHILGLPYIYTQGIYMGYTYMGYTQGIYMGSIYICIHIYIHIHIHTHR